MDTLLSRAWIPIIDLGLVEGEGEASWTEADALRVAAQLHRSLAKTGLALLVNHGVSEEKLRAGYEAMDRFCALPQDTRDAYRRLPPHPHGYVAPGTERLSEEWIGEIRHTFNVSVSHMSHSQPGGLPGGLHGAHAKVPPESEVPGFQDAVDDLGQEFKRLARLLLQAIALGVELPADFFLEHHKGLVEDRGQDDAVASSTASRTTDNESSLRLEFYPPFVAPPPAGVTRCGEHTDCGTLSLLAQDSEGGLEVQTHDGQWARVGHLPGALLIITGDIMAAWTCRRYVPTLHRVIVPEQPKVRARGRHAVGFLVQPDNDALISPVERLGSVEGYVEEREPITYSIRDFVDSSRRRKRSFYAPHHSIPSRLRETAAS